MLIFHPLLQRDKHTDDALKIVAASSSKAFLRGSDFIVRYGREAEVALWHYRPGRWLGAPEEAIATMSQFVEQHLSVGAAVSVYSQVLSLSFSPRQTCSRGLTSLNHLQFKLGSGLNLPYAAS